MEPRPRDTRLTSACAALLVEWLNARYGTRFAAAETSGGALVASEAGRRAGLYIAPLWDDDEAWRGKVHALEEELSAGEDGAYVLWVPPLARLPDDVTSLAGHVRAAAARLSPGERTEVSLPAVVKLGKTREEGGYASVSGGLSRWWTRITENVQGTFQVDSTAVHRLALDGEAREALWQRFGDVSRGMAVGQVVEIEVDEAWTLQRLATGELGFAVAAAPPSADPTDGIVVRRNARRRLQAANEALAALDVSVRIAGLIGAYEYAEVETASGTLKAIDPSLYSRLEVVALLIDSEVKPVFAPKALPGGGS